MSVPAIYSINQSPILISPAGDLYSFSLFIFAEIIMQLELMTIKYGYNHSI